MPRGRCATLDELPTHARAVVTEAWRAVLSTTNADGTVASVPICFAVEEGAVVTAIDHKPKSTRTPARVRNIRRDPRVTLLFDRWDEDWTRLGWVGVKGEAAIDPDGWDARPLVARYAPYHADPPAGPLIVVQARAVSWWTWSGPDAP